MGLVGAWIEMKHIQKSGHRLAMSLPSWERGLKSMTPYPMLRSQKVAPLVGAWIEICNEQRRHRKEWVAPLVGAWIEI